MGSRGVRHNPARGIVSGAYVSAAPEIALFGWVAPPLLSGLPALDIEIIHPAPRKKLAPKSKFFRGEQGRLAGTRRTAREGNHGKVPSPWSWYWN